MNKTIFLMTLALTLASCGGGNNKVDSGSSTPASNGSVNTLTPPPTTPVPTPVAKPLVNFAGHYVNVESRQDGACGATLEISNECNGYIVRSSDSRTEEFCHVQVVTPRNGGYDRNPPNPDRNPPNPDRNPPNPDYSNPGRDSRTNEIVVTQDGNFLKSEIRMGETFTFTNTMTLNDNGILEKVMHGKSNQYRCFYQKR